MKWNSTITVKLNSAAIRVHISAILHNSYLYPGRAIFFNCVKLGVRELIRFMVNMKNFKLDSLCMIIITNVIITGSYTRKLTIGLGEI